MTKQTSPSIILTLFLLLAGCATTPAPPANQSAEAAFRSGEYLYSTKHYTEAIAEWRKVKESSYSPELSALSALKIADALFEDGKYIEAAAEYENFRKLHPYNENAAYALFRLGLCNFKQITTIDVDQTSVRNAASTFESFLRQYPISPYAAEAREDLEICRKKMVQYEAYVGRFYVRTEKYGAAIRRLEASLAKTPDSPANDEVLLYLGEAYTLSGDKTKGKALLERLGQEFPSSPLTAEAKKFMAKHP